MRKLRGERYARGADPGFVKILTDDLPYFSFERAHRFYQEALPILNRNETALLGCNDRYFLLTGLLHREDAMHPWIYARAREVEHDPDGHLDLWARVHYKSTVITFAGAIQEAAIDPEIRIAIFSNNSTIAKPFLAQIKEELESNEDLKRTYPDVFWENPKKEAPSWSIAAGLTVKRRSNPREATFEAHGLIDALPTGKHFPLLIYDDVITERNVTNPETIKKTAERAELSHNLGVGNGTRKWWIGTRYSYADFYGEMLEMQIVKPRIYPATDDGRIDGNPIFLTPEAWEEHKRTQRSQIAAQMLQNPLAGTENTFRVQHLRPYEIRPTLLNIYIIGDPSRGRSKTSDRTAIVVEGIDPAGNKYLLDGYCHRMKLSERWQRLKELRHKWKNMPCTKLLRVGWERYGHQTDDEHFEAEMRRDGEFFDIQEVAWTREGPQSKNDRIERLEPDLRNSFYYVPHRVWHPTVGRNANWYTEHDNDEIHYKVCGGLTSLELKAKANGQHWRVFDPLKRRDEDGNIYDLTRVFFQELQFHPFSPRDDLLDAASRIYDMDPLAPRAIERSPEMAFPDY